jgi:hypothetical protein
MEMEWYKWAVPTRLTVSEPIRTADGVVVVTKLL